MCEKQCRDENGFNCHCTSESHQRQMEIFGQNPTRIVAGYSEEFERSFLEFMKGGHRSSPVAATIVYNEYIADRHHVHMNSTQWETLAEFVEHLEKTEKCKVEETEEGKLFITYIDRDSETLPKEKRRNRANVTDEEKHEREIKKQREQLIINIDDHTVEYLPSKLMKRLDAEKKIKLTLNSKSKSVVKKSSKSVFNETTREEEDEEERERRNRKDN